MKRSEYILSIVNNQTKISILRKHLERAVNDSSKEKILNRIAVLEKDFSSEKLDDSNCNPIPFDSVTESIKIGKLTVGEVTLVDKKCHFSILKRFECKCGTCISHVLPVSKNTSGDYEFEFVGKNDEGLFVRLAVNVSRKRLQCSKCN